jgi:hypothetical protein
MGELQRPDFSQATLMRLMAGMEAAPLAVPGGVAY